MRVILLFFICLNISCSQPAKNAPDDTMYFDLKGYFEQESMILSRTNPLIVKTVYRNGNKETGKVRVNWRNELALFIESDINKPAWRDSYRTIPNGRKTTYVTYDKNLKTRKIEIIRSGEAIAVILIVNRTSNFLYSSTEILKYYPGSAYTIVKKQDVKLLGSNKYMVAGKFE